MIRLITGVPGSGKSYLAMTEIVKVCEYDGFYDEYRPRDGVVILTNISDLKIEHVDLDEQIGKMGFDKFFNIDNFERIKKKYERVIIVIDECQRYFHSKTWDEKVAYAFQYHRHFGIDIILMTQDARVLPRGLSSLPEYIIKARSRSLNLGFRFVYDFHDSQTNSHLETKTVKKEQAIFRAYKSFKFDEKEKPKNALVRWGMVTLVTCALVVGAVFLFLHTFFPKVGSSASGEVIDDVPIRAKDLIKPPAEETIVVDNTSAYPTYPPTPEPRMMYVYPVTGFINDDKFLLPDGTVMSRPDCDWDKYNFEVHCLNPIILAGFRMNNGDVSRPDLPVQETPSRLSVYEETIKYLEEIKNLNLSKEVVSYDRTFQKN